MVDPAAAVTRRELSRLRLVASLAAAAALCLALIALSMAATPPAALGPQLVHDAAASIFVLIGVVAWQRRPQNLTGKLMLAAGVAWFVVNLKEVNDPLPYTIGDALGNVVYGVIAHLAIAFPSGRLQHTRERVLVAAMYVWVVVGNVLPVIFAPGFTCVCPHELLNVHVDRALYLIAVDVQQGGNLLAAALVLAVVVRHRWTASAPARRAMAPVIWAAGPIILVIVALQVDGFAFSPSWLPGVLNVVTPLALATLPVAFVAGLVRTRLMSTGVGHLVVELSGASEPDRIRDALARTLGDPTLQLAFFTDPEGWVDEAGKPVTLPADRRVRSYTVLEREGRAVAALVHDPSLDEDPTFVSSVAAAGALAIENERLRAELRAQLAEVQDSRARLVEVADTERRRIERDLHDGAQQRLLRLSLDLGRMRARAEQEGDARAVAAADDALAQARDALNELRSLAAGIRPAILTDSGLASALESLAERAPLPVTVHADVPERCPDSVEAAAYFTVSEAVANAAKHAGATQVTVEARVAGGMLHVSVSDDGAGAASFEKGTGLRGLRDRVAALQGTLQVTSPPGEGTRIEVTLPCG